MLAVGPSLCGCFGPGKSRTIDRDGDPGGEPKFAFVLNGKAEGSGRLASKKRRSSGRWKIRRGVGVGAGSDVFGPGNAGDRGIN